MYDCTKWRDRIVSAGTGAILQEGTDQNAAHFNNMETGIFDHHVAMALTQITRSNLGTGDFVTVKNILTDVATSTTDSVAYLGTRYSATLEALKDKDITFASVIMGGIDITSESFTYGSGSMGRKIGYVSIADVTGDIVITASAG